MGNSSFPGREKRKDPMISAGDAEFPRDFHTLAASGGRGARRFQDNSNGGFMSSSLDRRHNSVAAKSLEALNSIHKADIERQRDALMDLQKNKYSNSPGGLSQGSAVAGRQQQPNYWSFKTRTPRVTRLSPTQPALADQASRVSFASAENLETMSEPDIPIGFNRMNRLRQSLPLARSSSQAKLRAPGILFLQLGEEIRRVHLTHELTSLETLRALIVHMFPQRLTMAMLRSPSTALLIKDEIRNIFYELEDPRDVQDRCVIKIYCKEPVYGTYPGHHNPHLANGDMRREMVHAPQDSPPNRRLSNPPMSSQHSSASASPPQGSPSRARLLYSAGRPSSYAGPPHHTHSLPHPHSQSHHSSPHQQTQLHQPHHTQPAFCTSSSAILERRDVKPDDEVGGSRSMVLLRSDGGGIYADPYALGPDPSRLSLAGGPHSPLPARADPYASLYRRGGGAGPGSVRTLTSYSAAALQGELMESGVLYRPGGPLYNDAYTASMLAMGLTVPPSSPQKIPDMRDSYGGTLPNRGSPGRQSLRRDSVTSSVLGDSPKARVQGPGLGLTAEQLCLIGDGGGARPFGSPLLGNETETRERMEAMEKQIASLTGLLQRVLTRAPEADSPEKMESASDGSAADPGHVKKNKALTPSAPLALMPPPSLGSSQPITVSRMQMQLHLQNLQQNTNALRKQLSQLRNIQLENQDSVLSLLRQTESELSLMMLDAMRPQEDPLQRQRLLVEEERLKYLNQEELLIQQLHDLEKSVEELQRNSSINHGLVTEQDVDQKSKELRMLGETLTELKNQFPSLQSKMWVVLRVEVEAVKFLKEEPHRLEALLKRCNTMTDALSSLRRQVTDGVWKTPEEISSQIQKRPEDLGRSSDLDILNSPPLSLADLSTSAGLANWIPVSSEVNTSGSEQDVQSSMAFRSRVLDELPSRRPAEKAVSAEVRLAAERDWEEKRASLTQFSAQDINRLLEETQAELMKAIPDLDFAAKHINKPAVPPKPQITIPITSNTSTLSAAGTTGPIATSNAGGDQQPGKVQLAAQKLNSMEGSGSHRGSVDLSVARYKTEKPSKSPPPPPPRRSFPSAHGLTTNRTGDVIITTKNQKMDEDGEMPKTLVKLRRTPSDTPRPASTPPVIAASAVQDEDDEEKIIAELEIFQRAPVKDSPASKWFQSQHPSAVGRKNSSNSPGPTKGPTVAARLKHLQQGSLERPKTRKQKEDFPKVQGQQQFLFHPVCFSGLSGLIRTDHLRSENSDHSGFGLLNPNPHLRGVTCHLTRLSVKAALDLHHEAVCHIKHVNPFST
ncbi:SRC kinase signaling inhibitor 1 isoform X3 [Nothobranchius furzeri]|uniref:SRC kinase signaling inhibitor 1 isoform X3 n=1 Tax=Nothobranchius furzeri TaxID=105023 RepID=UPI0024047BEF|nr:SRC kinase signaling inhibitor 1 isoform X3 [Nothobranchius furzeri]